MKYNTKILFIWTLLSCFLCQSQNQDSLNAGRKRIAVVKYGFLQSVPIGDNYAGEGLSTASGFELFLSFRIIDNFYLGGALSGAYFKNENQNLLGNYNKTSRRGSIIYLGYEFQVNKQIHLRTDLGIGDVSFKNKSFTNQNFDYRFNNYYSIDDGTSYRLNVALDYAITPDFSVFSSVAYEYDRMNIQASPEFTKLFSKAIFVDFQVGLQINLLPRPINKDNIESSLYDDQGNIIPKDQMTVKQRRALYFMNKRKNNF